MRAAARLLRSRARLRPAGAAAGRALPRGRLRRARPRRIRVARRVLRGRPTCSTRARAARSRRTRRTSSATAAAADSPPTRRPSTRKACASSSCSTASARRRRASARNVFKRTAPGHARPSCSASCSTGAAASRRARASSPPPARRAGRAPRAQNPRLSLEWLRYFAAHGSRARARRAASGTSIRWRRAAPGPFRPDWIAPGWRRLRMPMLAVIGSEPDTWGPLPEPILAPRLANVPLLTRATVQDAGHFMHIEQPRETARLILDFLEARVMRLRSGRIEVALHELRADAGAHAPVSARAARPARRTSRSSRRPGRAACWRSISRATARPARPRGGSYTPELLAGDVDAALDHIAAGARRTAIAGRRRRCICSVSGSAPTSRCCSRARDPSACAPPICCRAPASKAAAPRRARRSPGMRCTRRSRRCSKPPRSRISRATTRWCACSRRIRGRRTTRAASPTAPRACCSAEDGSLRPPWWEAARESASALRAPADPRAGLTLLRAGVD